jgi:hypothetical protein
VPIRAGRRTMVGTRMPLSSSVAFAPLSGQLYE